MALTASNYRVYWLASDCATCIAGITDAGVLETLGGFTVEVTDNLNIGDAGIRWSAADPNAEALIIDLPAGDAEEVPLLVVGQAIEATNLGWFNGYTETNIAVVDLAKTSWAAFGFSAAGVPSISCGGVATYIKFLDMVHVGAFNSTTAGSGIPLSSTVSANVRVYSDDAGAAIVNTGVGDTRGLLSRFLVTTDHSANEVRFSGLMGHVKSYDGYWGNEQVSGVYGYLELARNAATLTLTDYGISAGSIACVENIGVVTVNTNHVLAGYAAISKITGDLAATGKTAGVYVALYDATNWSDATARVAWEYGLLIGSGAATADIGLSAGATIHNTESGVVTIAGLTRGASAYSNGIVLDADDIYFVGGAATKTRLLSLSGERPAGSAATGDSYDHLGRWDWTNYAANDANFKMYGLEINLTNRAAGTLGYMYGFNTTVRQRGDAGTCPNVYGYRGSLKHDVGGAAETGEVYGYLSFWEYHADAPADSAAFMAQNHTDGVYAEPTAAFAVRNDAVSGCQGFAYGLDLYDATAATVSTADVRLHSGALIQTGTADPNGTVTGVDGSLYLRTGTTNAATILYVCTGGTSWTAIT